MLIKRKIIKEIIKKRIKNKKMRKGPVLKKSGGGLLNLLGPLCSSPVLAWDLMLAPSDGAPWSLLVWGVGSG